MITSAQATQYLDQMLGVGAPGFLVDAAIAKVEAVEPDMAVYAEHDQILMQCMAVALLVAAGDPKRTASQHASSGASRSFKLQTADLTKLRRSLAALDTLSILSSVVGTDPAGSAFMMVV